MNTLTKVIFIILCTITKGDLLISESTSDHLRLGAFLCLTGSCASAGHDALQGIRLAVAEINLNGGILGKSIDLQIEDSKEDLFVSSKLFESFVKKHSLKFIVGPSNATTIDKLKVGPETLVFGPVLDDTEIKSSGIIDYKSLLSDKLPNINSKFRRMYEQGPGDYATGTYAFIYRLKLAIENSGDTPAELKQYFMRTKSG